MRPASGDHAGPTSAPAPVVSLSTLPLGWVEVQAERRMQSRSESESARFVTAALPWLSAGL